MITTALTIRNGLLSQDPQVQDATSRKLGHIHPWMELPGIASAIDLDVAMSSDDKPQLTARIVRRLVNATCSHLAMFDLIRTDHARSDVLAKAKDVAYAAMAWWVLCDTDDLLGECLQALRQDIERLKGVTVEVSHDRAETIPKSWRAVQFFEALLCSRRVAASV